MVDYEKDAHLLEHLFLYISFFDVVYADKKFSERPKKDISRPPLN